LRILKQHFKILKVKQDALQASTLGDLGR